MSKEPDYDAVEGAEIMLGALVRQLPTDVAVRLLEWRAAGGINPSFVPAPASNHYAVLWWQMGAHYATQAIRRMLAQVVSQRSYYEVMDTCPACGAPDAMVGVYDRGAYMVAEHADPNTLEDIAGAGWALRSMRRRCYVGPTPKPTTYQAGP